MLKMIEKSFKEYNIDSSFNSFNQSIDKNLLSKKQVTFDRKINYINRKDESIDFQWYSSLEIEKFKRNIKSSCRKARNRREKKDSMQENLEFSQCVRGLEFKLDTNRSRQRRFVIQKILEAQKLSSTIYDDEEKQNFLALVSSGLTFQSKCQALIEGKFE